MGIEFRVDESHIDEDGVRVITKATLTGFSIGPDDLAPDDEAQRAEHYRRLLAEGWSDYEARAIAYEEG